MAKNPRFLRALQCFADAARKINPNLRPKPTIQDVPSVLTSLPEHKSLLPLLLSYNIPPKLAQACSDRYDEYASQLKSETESKLAPYLANKKESRPAQVYSLFLDRYSQVLRCWSQSVLDTALVNLKRDPVLELQNLEVTHLAPFWLPLPSNQHFSRRPDYNCPLSPTSRPTHAFPTTYPPPTRPSLGISPVEWTRTPEAFTTTPTCQIDIDSLCDRFSASLIIDGNPRQRQQQKPSIFSLPVVTREELGTGRSRPKPLRRKYSPQVKEPLAPSARSSTSPPKILKSRKHSVPPFPWLSTRAKVTPRKTSAPPRLPIPRQAQKPLQSSDPTCHAVPTPPPLDISISGGTDRHPYLVPDLLDRQSSFNSTFDTTIHTPQGSSESLTGPTTPPTFLPNLFSEPLVVPATPVHLSPRSSLMHITDPFLQFEPQYDYLPAPSLDSTLSYSTSTPGLATSYASKSPFDTPLGFDHLFHGNLIPTTPGHFESALFNTCGVL